MLSCELRAVGLLDGATVDAMYALLDRHYGATSRQRFEQDLTPKQWVLVLRDEAGDVQGFSTLQVYAREHQGQRCRVLYSGDTVIAREHWGEQELAFNWLRLAGRLHAEQPGSRMFWFLISKGHRTFRYLPAFACTFYPNWHDPTPAFEAGLLERLAREHFGDCYDAARGVIGFPQSLGHLREELAGVSARERRLEAVRFFLERNPGYAKGDELCCLCELTPANLKPIGRRLFLKGMVETAADAMPCRA